LPGAGINVRADDDYSGFYNALIPAHWHILPLADQPETFGGEVAVGPCHIGDELMMNSIYGQGPHAGHTYGILCVPSRHSWRGP
jgi:hypothetical protein